MIRENNRLKRVAQEIKRGIAEILQHKIKDPRISMMVTVSFVEISRNLEYAKVYVTFLNNGKDKFKIRNNINMLQQASGYIRFSLSKIIYLRIVPKLNFFYDNSLTERIRISNLITSLTKHKSII